MRAINPMFSIGCTVKPSFLFLHIAGWTPVVWQFGHCLTLLNIRLHHQIFSISNIYASFPSWRVIYCLEMSWRANKCAYLLWIGLWVCLATGPSPYRSVAASGRVVHPVAVGSRSVPYRSCVTTLGSKAPARSLYRTDTCSQC